MQRRSFLKSLLALVAAPVVAKVVLKKEEPVLVPFPYTGKRVWINDGTSDCYLTEIQNPLSWDDLEPIYQEAKKQEGVRSRIKKTMNMTPFTPEQLRRVGMEWTKNYHAHPKK